METACREIIYLYYIHDTDTRKVHAFLIDIFKYTIKTGEGGGRCQMNYFRAGENIFQ